VDNVTLAKLKTLSPESYIGLAVELTDNLVGGKK